MTLHLHCYFVLIFLESTYSTTTVYTDNVVFPKQGVDYLLAAASLMVNKVMALTLNDLSVAGLCKQLDAPLHLPILFAFLHIYAHKIMYLSDVIQYTIHTHTPKYVN